MTELSSTLPTREVDSRLRRRSRIVDTAASMAERVGCDAVAMRAVAAGAGVSTATLYRYFPSKHHLLVATLVDWLEWFDARVDVEIAELDEPFERLWFVVDNLYASLRHRPFLAEAMARAYVVADASVASRVEDVRKQVTEIFTAASPGRDAAIGALLSDVWAASVLALSRNRASGDELRARLATTVRVLSERTN